jgi:hypothetical protein
MGYSADTKAYRSFGAASSAFASRLYHVSHLSPQIQGFKLAGVRNLPEQFSDDRNTKVVIRQPPIEPSFFVDRRVLQQPVAKVIDRNARATIHGSVTEGANQGRIPTGTIEVEAYNMKQETTTITLPVPVGAPSPVIDTETLELLEQWRREDFTDDPELLRAAELELEEFKKALNANRAACGERLLFP